MPGALWLVVGGDATGGIIARKSRGTASAQLPERLCTGAIVRELSFAVSACRLHYERVTGTGPERGWVSTKVPGKELVVKTESGWKVVGGTEAGGIIVRTGKEATSPAASQRLCTGAVVEELELAPEIRRLRFRRVLGTGPRSGWVCTRVPESDMLVRLRECDWQPGRSLPTLDLTEAASAEEACAAARRSRRALRRLVEDLGGVLVDAPALRGPADFSRCMREVMGEGLAKDYPGLVRRHKAADQVFTTTEVHPNMPIPGHTELSYMPASKPDYIAFFCEDAPEGVGGQTPAIDMRAVLSELPKDLLERFRAGVRCSVNVPPEPGTFLIPSQLDPGGACFRPLNRTWKKFGADRDEATEGAYASARAAGRTVEVDWDGDWLRRFEHMDTIAPHPTTGELLWTGYNPRFHWCGTLSQALFDVAFHNRTLRQVLVAAALSASTAVFVLCRFLSRLPCVGRRLPAFLSSPGTTSSILEDGSAISAWDAFRIVRCYNRHLLTWRWRPGLFALLDNHRLGHLRTPYDPHQPRKVYTAFGSDFAQV